ncbi:MAG: carbamoyltransferase [Candidatus Woesearchaeota archaeon]|nr:carbamoyltransferase [Candidatus Woesearchaeota archaeon]
MYILGLSCYYHDASAVLLKDGKLVAGAEEERFSRKKHDTSFPKQAIQFCLEKEGIAITDVTHIGFYEKPFLKFERVLSQMIATFPWSFRTFLSSMPSWINEKLRVMRAIRNLGYKGDVLFVEHHMAHAASSFLVSPFEKAAILTVDGVGEWTTTAYGKGVGKKITLLKDIRFPHSLGLLYSTITTYIGFRANSGEFKLMGLAPYGVWDKRKNPYYKKLRKVIDIKKDGSYALDMSYFKYHYANRMPSEKLCELLGGTAKKPESKITQREKDIAAAVQMLTEDVLTKILKHIHNVTKCDDLVLAGGVTLNSVYNGKILKKTPFKNIWIQPAAGDSGTSIGVATYIYNTLLGKKRQPQQDAYLGPSFTTKEIKQFLDENKIKYSTCKNEKELITKTAKILHTDNVVGWFQLGMEWGPRALGARSILSNPTNPDMQAILNEKVKHRENFRPFAPVVCEDDAKTFFDCDEPVPEPTDYMLMVYPVREEWRKKIPSVTHVDGSGRLQTIRRAQNKRYYDLIKAFGEASGIPILVNTSFNIRGEPIVCTPAHAYRCMMGTGIDCLVIDKFIVWRKDNKQDMWDSESLAID